MFAEDCHYYYSYMVEHLWVRHCALHKLSQELKQHCKVEIIASFSR